MDMFKEGMKGFEGINFGCTQNDGIRNIEEIEKLKKILFDRVWFERSQINSSEASVPAQKMIIKTYGKEFLPLSYDNPDFDWGYINGVFAALRWVLGMEMDMLDT